jgi:hypothetical protein
MLLLTEYMLSEWIDRLVLRLQFGSWQPHALTFQNTGCTFSSYKLIHRTDIMWLVWYTTTDWNTHTTNLLRTSINLTFGLLECQCLQAYKTGMYHHQLLMLNSHFTRHYIYMGYYWAIPQNTTVQILFRAPYFGLCWLVMLGSIHIHFLLSPLTNEPASKSLNLTVLNLPSLLSHPKLLVISVVSTARFVLVWNTNNTWNSVWTNTTENIRWIKIKSTLPFLVNLHFCVTQNITHEVIQSIILKNLGFENTWLPVYSQNIKIPSFLSSQWHKEVICSIEVGVYWIEK